MHDWKRHATDKHFRVVASALVLILALASVNCGSTGAADLSTGATSSVTMNPVNAQFGNVPVNTSVSQTLTFTNPATSSSSVSVSNVTITGAGFTLTQTPTLPLNIAAGQSASLTAQVLPTAPGAITGTITITSSATPSTLTVNLSATGVTVTGQPTSITGTITPASQSAGSTVSLVDSTGKTVDTVTVDSAGNYTLFAITNGAYTIVPSGASLFFAPTNQSISATGTAQTGVNFTASSNSPVPTISSLSPNSISAGSGGFTLTINGSNFLSTSAVTYNGVAHAATFISGSQLTIQLSATDLSTPGTFAVVVTNPAPGGGPSTPANFVVGNPVPAITSFSPASLAVGSPAQTLTINGSTFVSGATVSFNAIAHAATFVSSTKLTIQLSAADLSNPGNFPVVVTNPAPGGGTSNSLSFAIGNPVATITSLSPASLAAGSSPQTLTIGGSGFLASSTATYNGIAHTVTFVSASQITISLGSSDLATAGNFPVVVTNPAPAGGSSTPVNFQVTNPAPLVNSISPTTIPFGSAAQTLTINGSNFIAASIATYNGVSHVATFVSSTQLTIQLTAADLAAAGTFPVLVTNPAPGGGVSLSQNLSVTGLSVSSTLSFGSVPDGTASASQNGTLTAVGGSITVNAPTVSGAGFAVSGVSFPVTLASGQSVQFGVTFSPASGVPGAVNGNAQFTSSANNVIQTFSGTGTRNVVLSWNASTTAGVTYNVYRCIGSCSNAPTNYVLVPNGGGITSLSFNDTDPVLQPGTLYFYAITAVASGAESDFSATTSVTTVP